MTRIIVRCLTLVFLSLAAVLLFPPEAEAQARFRPLGGGVRPGQQSTPGLGSDRVGGRFGDGRAGAARRGSAASSAASSVEKILSDAAPEGFHQQPERLLGLMQQALEHQGQFWDTAENRSPWGVMHATLAWGPTGEILIQGRPYNAIEALCDNQALKGVRLLSQRQGQLVPLSGPGLQGHPGQLLAILAQNDVPLSQTLTVDGRSFTLADLVRYEQKTCKPNTELTFKLIGLAHYLPMDEIWKAEDGGTWSIERLLRLELRAPINGQTCGGTHRLMGIHLAVEQRRRQDLSFEGVWPLAEQYVQDYHEYALALFNPDGSFSTDWFERRAALDDPQRRLQTTGHVLEWLAVSLPEQRLMDEQIVTSFAYLSALLLVDIGESWAVGPRGHALRALRIYQQRLGGYLEAESGDSAAGIVVDTPVENLPADRSGILE